MAHGTHDAISTSDMVIQNVIDDLICRLSDTKSLKVIETQPEFRTAFAIQKLRKQKKDTMRRRSIIDCIASEENLRQNIVKSTFYIVLLTMS